MVKCHQLLSNDFKELVRTQATDLQITYVTNGIDDGLTSKVPGAGAFSASPVSMNTSDWYHAAFVYDDVDSTTNNVRIYFTELDDSKTEASVIGTSSTVSSGPNHISSTFWISSPSGGQANALYDELRISNIARSADNTMFSWVPEPPSIALAALGLLALVDWRLRHH